MLVSQMRKVGLASSRENRAQTWTRALSSRVRVERLPSFRYAQPACGYAGARDGWQSPLRC